MFHVYYEPEITHTLMKILSKGNVFIDVGAHFGRYTLLASKIVGKEGLVIALEPIPETYAVLRRNIEYNSIENVIALPVAVWHKDGLLEFIVPPSKSTATAKKLTHFSGLKLRGKRIYVKALTLDKLIYDILKLKRVDVIKIDVEGSEVEVLLGARRTLEEHHPIIIIEVRRTSKHLVERILRMYKYRIAHLDENTLIAS